MNSRIDHPGVAQSGREDAPTPQRSRERHELKTAWDVAALFAKLDDEGRAILVTDLIKAGDGFAKLPELIRAITQVSSMTWIDDDKGRGDYVVRLSEDGPEVGRFRMFGDGGEAVHEGKLRDDPQP